MSGSRLPVGGAEELERLVLDDPVLRVHRPVLDQAVTEFGPAFAELRTRIDLRSDRVGVTGGIVGCGGRATRPGRDLPASARGGPDQPVVGLRDTIDGLSRFHGVSHDWSDASSAFVERVDFVARAPEVAALPGSPAVLPVTGEDDLEEAIRTPAAVTAEARRQKGRIFDAGMIPGMGHAVAAEPGTDAAPPLPQAAAVDRYAAAWFASHLRGCRSARAAALPPSPCGWCRTPGGP